MHNITQTVEDDW